MSILGSDNNTVVGPKSLRVNDKLKLRFEGVPYQVQLNELSNSLIGEDFAKFTVDIPTPIEIGWMYESPSKGTALAIVQHITFNPQSAEHLDFTLLKVDGKWRVTEVNQHIHEKLTAFFQEHSDVVDTLSNRRFELEKISVTNEQAERIKKEVVLAHRHTEKLPVELVDRIDGGIFGMMNSLRPEVNTYALDIQQESIKPSVTLYHNTSENLYYIQWVPPLAGGNYYYGPYTGNPFEELGLKLPGEKAAKKKTNSELVPSASAKQQ